jgi:hypothetical protein
MADPIPPVSPWIAILQWIEKTIKDNWSGLAVILYGYEEKKIDAAKQQQKTAQLQEKLAEDENTIRKDASSKSDLDIISDELGTDSNGKPKA